MKSLILILILLVPIISLYWRLFDGTSFVIRILLWYFLSQSNNYSFGEMCGSDPTGVDVYLLWNKSVPKALLLMTMTLVNVGYTLNSSLRYLVRKLVARISLSHLIRLLDFFRCWSLDCRDRSPRCRRIFFAEGKLARLALPLSFLHTCGVSAPGSVRLTMGVVGIADDLNDVARG
ncbi:hypothetical protein KSS87_021094 [Heliosperma pusillum]|nr:hypothetical protein KSS87_021094 [Heliosperma pusillum]